MIDFHAHFLPEIDDGAKDVAESIKMLKDSFAQGVEICVGTPHAAVHSNDSIGLFLEKRERSIAMLEKALEEEKSEIPRLYYGAEVFLDNPIAEYENIGKLCLADTNCLLVELSVGEYNPNYSEWLYSLTVKGIVPIIAHVERYPYLEELTVDLNGVNVFYQINANTVIHRNGRSLLEKQLMDAGGVVISSDMHNTAKRKTQMKKAFDKVNKSMPEIAFEVFEKTPKSILGL